MEQRGGEEGRGAGEERDFLTGRRWAARSGPPTISWSAAPATRPSGTLSSLGPSSTGGRRDLGPTEDPSQGAPDQGAETEADEQAVGERQGLQVQRAGGGDGGMLDAGVGEPDPDELGGLGGDHEPQERGGGVGALGSQGEGGVGGGVHGGCPFRWRRESGVNRAFVEPRAAAMPAWTSSWAKRNPDAA